MTSHPSFIEKQYEALRQQALEGHSYRSHSFLLFSTRGMVAWLEALTALIPPCPTVCPERDPSADLSWERASFHREEITHVLADMVLACSGEVFP